MEVDENRNKNGGLGAHAADERENELLKSGELRSGTRSSKLLVSSHTRKRRKWNAAEDRNESLNGKDDLSNDSVARGDLSQVEIKSVDGQTLRERGEGAALVGRRAHDVVEGL